MHSDISMILKIPFESKKAFNPKSNSKYAFKGDAYYLINKAGKILRDFMIIDEDSDLTYRPNDNNMRIGNSGTGTDFYKRWGTHREMIFDSSPLNSEVKNATPIMKQALNEFLLNESSTVLIGESIISGSNPSGADATIKATPIVSTDSVFYGMRFTNALKTQRVNSKNTRANTKFPISETELKVMTFINLSDYIKMFKSARKEFYRFNPESYDLIFQDETDITQKIYFVDFDNKRLDVERTSYQDNVLLLLSKYQNDELKRKSLIDRLRGILRALLIIEHQQKNVEIVIGRDEKDSNMDAAHLFDVRWIKKLSDDELWTIADVNNGLLLPKDIHWKFDKEKDFTLNNDFDFVENGTDFKFKINDAYINEARRKYIIRRNEKLSKTTN